MEMEARNFHTLDICTAGNSGQPVWLDGTEPLYLAVMIRTAIIHWALFLRKMVLTRCGMVMQPIISGKKYLLISIILKFARIALRVEVVGNKGFRCVINAL